MIDNNDRDFVLLDPADVVIPQGWKVISHGTNFNKWETPAPGRPSQDLQAQSRITIHNTISGGLACCSDDDSNMPFVYAGNERPVIMRIFVPQYGPNFDMEAIEEGLRFLKPQGFNQNEALVPSDTSLIKIAEDYIAGKDMPVFWYVPEQFASLLEKDLLHLQRSKAAKAKESDEILPGFNLDDSFAPTDVEGEEHLLEQEEKADEYFEDLEEQQQALIDAELAAEEKLAAKREKDKKKAREQDKKNFARAEAEHARQMAEANMAREQSEMQSGIVFSSQDPYSFSDQSVPVPESNFSDVVSEQTYEFGERSYAEPYSESKNDNFDLSGEQPIYDPSKPFSERTLDLNETYLGGSESLPREESVRAENDHQTLTEIPSDLSTSNDVSEIRTNADALKSVDPVGIAPNNSDAPNYEKDEVSFPYDTNQKNRNQELKADILKAEENLRQEENKRFHDELQAEALRRQEKADNYVSIGSHGIDFSGHDDHAAYSEAQTSQNEPQPRAFERSPQENSSAAVSGGLDTLESMASGREGKFAQAVAHGFVNTVAPTTGSSPSGYGQGAGAHSQSFATVQNMQTGDAPTPRSAASLKDPPKSPVDYDPLYFSKERFQAIRRFANNVNDSSLRIEGVVKNQLVQSAAAEETGTARSMMSTTRTLSATVAAMDILANGNGKAEAEKIWTDYLAKKQGIKPHQIDKQAVRDFGKINVKNINTKLKESLTESDLANLHKKYGKAADVGIAAATGTKNYKIGKRDVFVNGKVDVRLAEGQIGALRERSTNLKAEIKALGAKGGQLSVAERHKLSDLLEQKKSVDEKLRKMVGATNARYQTEQLYRQINAMSPRKLKKELKKLEDKIAKGLKLNPLEARQYAAMQERKALLDMREKLRGGHFVRLKMLVGTLGRQFGKLLRKSNDETLANMASMAGGIGTATRFATNRYVRGALKWSVKTALTPARLSIWMAKKIDRKVGASKAVVKRTHQVADATKSKILHSKPVNKLKSKVSPINNARKKVGNVAKKATNKTRTVAKKISEAFQKFNNNRFVRIGKGVLKAPLNAFKFVGKAINAVKTAVLKYVIAPICCFLLVICLVSVVCTLIANIPTNVYCDDDLDLTKYIKILNQEQEAINDTVAGHKNNTEVSGGKYRNVSIEYMGGTNSNNFKEILSMTAVYFNQDFANQDAVKEYIVKLFNATNYVTTDESPTYFCSGCKPRDYFCYEAPDKYATDERIDLYKSSDHGNEKNVGDNAHLGCIKGSTYSCMTKGHGTYNAKGCVRHNSGNKMEDPGNCDNYETVYVSENRELVTYYVCQGHCSGKHYDYSCPGHNEKICKGHIDLYVNVVCMGFDEIFSVDPGVTVGLNLGDYKQGDLIGTFNITYYCSCADCCGKTDGITFSGAKLTPGRTIAVDQSVIPIGTSVIINGHVYVAEDTGGHIKGNRIDIACASHQEALNLGKDVFKVYKAVDKDVTENESGPRKEIDYLLKAVEAERDDFVSTQILKCFGKAKEPEVKWRTGNKVQEDNESYAIRLKSYDQEHKGKAFTNVEWNTFQYVQMSLAELTKLVKEHDQETSYTTAYHLISEVLIPYDKEHPDVWVNEPTEEDEKLLYFEGWNEDNKEWAKNIYTNMTPDIYVGLDEMEGSIVQGSISLEGIEIQGSQINVKYFCQKDYPNTPMIPTYPHYTIKTSGCGFVSMSIVISSLTNQTVDPIALVQKYGSTYYCPGQGSYVSIVEGLSGKYGLNCQELGNTYVQRIINSLNDGKLVVILVGKGGAGYTGNGYYKGGGHFLVIRGVTEDGKFLLADPNQKSVSLSGQPIDMQHFLDSGVKNAWSISK